jgi:ribosomal protein S11
MKLLRTFATTVIALAVVSSSAAAQGNIAAQTVTFEVSAISLITVTGSPTLVVAAATAGGAPSSATNNSTSYSLTTNEPNKKITAVLNQAMPANVSLEVSLATPGSGTSAGNRTLTTTGVDVVTGISPVNGSGAITYTLSATAAAGTVASQTRTVTFTVLTGP